MTLLQHWNALQLMRLGNIPHGANYYVADRDEAYSTIVDGEEVIYCDGSNKFREWLENFLAWPSFFFGMFLGFGNVAREMIRKGLSDDLHKVPVRIVAHSRGVFGMGLALALFDDGFDIREVILMGAPKGGGRRFYKHCKKRGIKVTMVVIVDYKYTDDKGKKRTVKGDFVPKIPWWGKHYYTNLIEIPNYNKIKGIKDIHLSYPIYFEELGL